MTMSSPTRGDREVFEAWVVRHFRGMTDVLSRLVWKSTGPAIERYLGEEGNTKSLKHEWSAWQAASATARAQEREDTVEAWNTPCDYCDNTGRDGDYACQACDRMGDDDLPLLRARGKENDDA